MRENILRFIPTLLSFLYKTNCTGCNCHSNYNICPKCLQTIGFNSYLPTTNALGVKEFYATDYDNAVRKSILALKYKKSPDVAIDLAILLNKYWQTTELSGIKFQVIPIPMHKSKKKIRKYNQVELITRNFSFISNNYHNPGLLKRIKNTQPQYNLNKKERFNNLKDCFSVDPAHIKSFPVLLIDDIYTTGSTITEAIRTLQSHNINNITVLTLSQVNLHKHGINIQ